MDRVYDQKKDCYGCSACFNICPVSTITMEPDDEGFLYPVIGNDCIDCNLCRDICPKLVKGHYKESSSPDFFVAKHKSEDVLMKSTSGGMFSALSDAILEMNGIVYGADYDDEFKVFHNRASDSQGRDRMRISKYVQSNLTDIFHQIKKDLENSKAVLFTGTPCQTAGLSGYIGDSDLRDNLYLCDLICHSIPSPLIWEEYKKLLEDEHGGKLTDIQFRSKIIDWSRENSNNSFLYKTDSSEDIHNDDRFYKLFFGAGTITRPSCEFCNFTDIHRASDVTIADYWGIEKYAPEWMDVKGVSLVMTNTEKGKRLLDKCQPNILIEKRPMEESLNEQNRLSKPADYPDNRNEFWKDYEKYGFKYLIEKITK